jgi:hypothetical protein
MDVIHARCCGIDVHQASLAVCVSIKEQGRREKHKLRCGTTTVELLRLADWLQEHGVTQVAMEATGVYWKPVWHVLEGQFELVLTNPAQVKALGGRKSDLKDGERIADFLQHGLLQGSFVPPRAIQQLRDLTRSRTLLKQEQARISNRILKTLEDANIKLSSIMTDVMGVSGRGMLRAMIQGGGGYQGAGRVSARKTARQDSAAGTSPAGEARSAPSISVTAMAGDMGGLGGT